MRRRLVVLSTAITAMVVIAFVVPLGLMVRELAADRATTPAQLRAQSLAPIVGLADTATVEAAVAAAEQAIDGDVHVVTPQGAVLGAPVPDGIATDVAAVYEQPDGSRVAVVPVVAGAGQGVVVVTVPAGALRRGVAAAWALLGALGLFLIAGAAWLTDRLARTSTRALADVEAGARQLSSGDLTTRVEVAEPVEVGRIADALNDLAKRTGELLTEERERAADVSHALRTPLTALRLDAEALPVGTAGRDRVLDDLAALEAAVDRAIHEARRPVREGGGRRCDLAGVVRERTAWWSALAEDEDRELAVVVEPVTAWVQGSRSDLTDVVDALIGNVFSHTDPGVDLEVALDLPEPGTVQLRVRDHGPGFPADVDVLARGVSGGGSTGLGLSIVQSTVDAAGGTLAVDRGSSTITIDLPELPGPR